jgi:hypothetical protein
MAQVVNGSQVRLANGQTVSAQQGGWYDGQQFWGGSLSNPGQINSQSNQQGAGQQVSAAVNAQSDKAQGLAPGTIQNFINNGGATGAPAPAATPGGASGLPGGLGTGGSGGSLAGGAGGLGISPAATLNLPDLYNTLNKNAGIPDLENQLTQKQQAFNDAQSKINDNPFLSESNRVGRVQKLQNDYNNDTKTISDTIAMKKADVQTQLDIQQKQFDINSQSAKAAMDQFNTLLTSGALDGASGSDIAAITQATGMSSNMIQAAINASVKKNTPTQVISFDDGTNQGFAVINPQTGAIISKQVIAGSKILGTAQDKGAGGGGALSPQQQIAQDKVQAPQYAVLAAKAGKTLPDMLSTFGQYGMTPQQIYSAYNAVNYYHATPAQQAADKKRYNVK